MDAEAVLARLQAEPGIGWRADELASELGLETRAVETALETLRSQGLIKHSVGGNWFAPKPPEETTPVGGTHSPGHRAGPEVPPGTPRVLLVHAPALATDTVLHLSYREGSDHYRLRRYAGGDPLEHGKPYTAPGAKTVQELRRMYGPFPREDDLTYGRDNAKNLDAWRDVVRRYNEKWDISAGNPADGSSRPRA